MKIRSLLSMAIVSLLTFPSFAQTVQMTRNGKISFFSKTSLENIDAVNNEVFSAIETEKGDIAFAVLINGFHFERALMEEHFNENYMESTKFPKSTFYGKILNLNEVKFKINGRYPVQVEGDLTIHGVTKKMNSAGEIIVHEGKISTKASMKIKLRDFNIDVPSVVSEKIAEAIDVTIDCTYLPKAN